MAATVQPMVQLIPPTPRVEHSAQAQYTNGSSSRSSSPSPPSSAVTGTTSIDTTPVGKRRPTSSETTAVGIFSMYDDPGAGSPEEPHPMPFKPRSSISQDPVRTPSPAGSKSSVGRQAPPQPRPGHTPTHSGQGFSAGSVQLAYLGNDDPQEERALSPPQLVTRLPQEAYLSPANGSKGSLTTSPTSTSHRSPNGSPNGSLSLPAKHAEDPDAYHVRNTYAQLDVSGVPGDGVEEGVELTRARLGASVSDPAASMQSLDGARTSRVGDLGPKEQELVKSLNRYGFFQNEASDRLVRVPRAAMLKPLSVVVIPSSDAPSPSQLALPRVPDEDESLRQVEVRRIAKWARMLEPQKRDGGNIQTWTVVKGKEHKLRDRVYKGIPDRWRAAAWEVLIRRYVGDRLELADLAKDYRETLDQPSIWEIQIDLDVPRTISGHVMFRTRYGMGQRSLFHVLHGFSLLCKDCGYCQGMGSVAATLLCYYEAERVYAFLVQLHTRYNMHGLFMPGFPGLLESLYVQERVMENMMPAVWTNFKKNMITATAYATKWYITLFSNTVPFRTQLRIWDALFLDGPDVLIVMAVGIIWGFRDQLGAPNASFEVILSLLSSFFIPETDDSLMHWVSETMSDGKLRADMQRWRTDFQRLYREGRHMEALL